MFNMKCLLLFHVPLMLYCTKFTSANRRIKSPAASDYMHELEQINGTCTEGIYSCKTYEYQLESSVAPLCLCHRPCVNLRACCFDSPYRNLAPTVEEPSCRKPTDDQPLMYMIEKCPDSTEFDLKTKCEIGWNENADDYFLLVPVHSLATNMTYKNYFCFRCNEDHDERVYWNPKLSADIDEDTVIKDINIVPVYDHTKKSWLAPFGEAGTLIEVSFSVEAPAEIMHFTKSCFENVISSCPEEWEDDEIRYKCYKLPTLITSYDKGDFVYYKNPYCALCNFEDLNEKTCDSAFRAFGIPKVFSFSLLLDINQSDGDKVGKIQKCPDNEIWDPYFERCRTLKCALPGYVVKDGKCIKA